MINFKPQWLVTHFRLNTIVALSVLTFSACSSIQSNPPLQTDNKLNESLLVEEGSDALPVQSNVDIQFGSNWENCQNTLVAAKELSLWTAIATSDNFDPLYVGDQDEYKEIERRIAFELSSLLKKKDQVQTILNRGVPFIATLVEQLNARKLPVELALLPAIESGYKVSAYSKAGAAGLWQFMPRTARSLGLKTGWWFDERHDPLSATASAMDYLEWLHAEFEGDWSLALAAYNAGPGRVGRARLKAQTEGRNDSYWFLDLAKETRQYVPKLLALQYLVRFRDDYNLKLEEPASPYIYTWVNAKHQIDIQKAAKFCEKYEGYSSLEFLSFNAGFRRWATPPDGPHRFRIPVPYAKQFASDLSSIKAEDRLSWGLYRIRRGDNLSRIAKRFKTRVSKIKEMNGIRGHRITAGDQILVPGVPAATTAQRAKLAQSRRARTTPASSHQPAGFNEVSYVVQRGDNLWTIARKLDTRVRYIKERNKVGTNNLLKPGDSLLVPVPYYAAATDGSADEGENQEALVKTSQNGVTRYTVQDGDSLYSIAKQFNTSVDALLTWNNLDEGNYLQPGQLVVMYLKQREQTPG